MVAQHIPFGRQSVHVSSRTVFMFSIHKASTGPSKTIHLQRPKCRIRQGMCCGGMAAQCCCNLCTAQSTAQPSVFCVVAYSLPDQLGGQSVAPFAGQRIVLAIELPDVHSLGVEDVQKGFLQSSPRDRRQTFSVEGLSSCCCSKSHARGSSWFAFAAPGSLGQGGSSPCAGGWPHPSGCCRSVITQSSITSRRGQDTLRPQYLQRGKAASSAKGDKKAPRSLHLCLPSSGRANEHDAESDIECLVQLDHLKVSYLERHDDSQRQDCRFCVSGERGLMTWQMESAGSGHLGLP